MPDPAQHDEDTEFAGAADVIDPEPLSALLVVLGAAGSLGTLFQLIEKPFREVRSERQANRIAIRDAIMGAETALNELQSYVTSLEIAFLTGAGEDARNSIARFGRVQLYFGRDGHDRWQEIESAILASVGKVNRYMADITRHFAVSHLRLPRDCGSYIERAINALNGILERLNQTRFEELFRSLHEAVGVCMTAMRQLRIDTYDLLR